MRRFAFTAAGVLCVALAVLGVFLPGLPTTPFLLLAGYLFARGHPAWGERVLAHRLFRPYRPFVEGTAPIPPRVRWTAITVVWLVVSGSFFLLRATGKASTLTTTALVASALIGSLVIWRFRR